MAKNSEWNVVPDGFKPFPPLSDDPGALAYRAAMALMGWEKKKSPFPTYSDAAKAFSTVANNHPDEAVKAEAAKCAEYWRRAVPFDLGDEKPARRKAA
jgi:hypothetical protein